MSLAFLALFAGYNAAQGLQSSVNGKMGLVNLGVLYGTFTLCCISAPAVVQRMEDRGCPMRLALLASALVYVLMVLVNIIPVSSGNWGAVFVGLFSNLLVGLAAPVLWTIQNLYVGRLSVQAARCSQGEDGVAGVMSAFNGMFFSIYQFSGAVGAGASSLLLAIDDSKDSRTLLFAMLGAFSFFGALGFLAMPPLPRASSEAVRSDGAEAPPQTGCSQTLVLLAKDRRMALTAPLIFVNGCFLAFVFGDCQRSFVTSTMGPSFTGPALLAFYLTNSAASSMWGGILRRGQATVWTVFVLGTVLQSVALLLWVASAARALPLFIEHYRFDDSAGSDVHRQWVLTEAGEPKTWEYVAPFACLCIAAVGDAVYESQLPAVLQAMFRDERMAAAMANLKLWQSLGFATQFTVGAVVESPLIRVSCLAGVFCVAFAVFIGIRHDLNLTGMHAD